MNKLSRISATIDSHANPFRVRSSLFHCSPVLERRRRTHWDSASSFRSSPRNFNQYSKRLRKQALLRNVSDFADHLFQNWKEDRDEYEEPSGRGSSWFRPGFREGGHKRGKARNWNSRTSRRGFEFCHDDGLDDAFENIYHSVFSGGTRHFYWFKDDESPRHGNSWSYSGNYRMNGGWEYEFEDEYDTSQEFEKPTTPKVTSDRLALGLSPSGPLNLDDVKNAYRACALKWHPDRHQGSSKVVAEEKFKACSAAYQSLCDKLDLQ
ncbi:uncharacterized protein LOC127256656 [Andrographis paniculata]|uniref:uncharacterized protein LOC127256656 n=1 Tax=Andrographis paniculata TaxID=175694 RepID=UPI0021E71D6D|nr:uncharacterized protein LOC127256656 [Andrographis paniculata]